MCAALDDGRAIACATTSDHTQKVLRTLLFGSLKSLQDLSEELQVQVNWVNATCDNVQKELVQCYGYSADASK